MRFNRSHPHYSPTIIDAEPFKIDGVYCRLIPLTQGIYTIVNASDYAWLAQWKWCACWNPEVTGFYAVRVQCGKDGERETIPMHRLILGLCLGDEREGDHESGCTIDNRRDNLRIVTQEENKLNKKKYKNNTSGYKGVSWKEKMGRWIARIQINGKRHHLGYFLTAELAYDAYCAAATKYYGEFARTL